MFEIIVLRYVTRQLSRKFRLDQFISKFSKMLTTINY